MTFLQVLPLAIVMVVGPQILSSIFFATSPAWRRNSAAFVGGGALGIAAVVSASYLAGDGASDQGASDTAIYWVILALLLFAMVKTFLGRKNAEPPKWMARLQTADVKFAFVLGLLLLSVFPSDLVTGISVGSYFSARGEPLWHALGFVGLTVLLLALPALAVLLLGSRAERVLPRVRDWMNRNSWIVNELVLLLFVGMVIGNIAG